MLRKNRNSTFAFFLSWFLHSSSRTNNKIRDLTGHRDSCLKILCLCTLGSRGYFFLIDTDGSRRSRVNEALRNTSQPLLISSNIFQYPISPPVIFYGTPSKLTIILSPSSFHVRKKVNIPECKLLQKRCRCIDPESMVLLTICILSNANQPSTTSSCLLSAHSLHVRKS